MPKNHQISMGKPNKIVNKNASTKNVLFDIGFASIFGGSRKGLGRFGEGFGRLEEFRGRLLDFFFLGVKLAEALGASRGGF